MTRQQLTEFSMFLPKTSVNVPKQDRIGAMINLEYRRKIGGMTKEQYLAEMMKLKKT